MLFVKKESKNEGYKRNNCFAGSDLRNMFNLMFCRVGPAQHV